MSVCKIDKSKKFKNCQDNLFLSKWVWIESTRTESVEIIGVEGGGGESIGIKGSHVSGGGAESAPCKDTLHKQHYDKHYPTTL